MHDNVRSAEDWPYWLTLELPPLSCPLNGQTALYCAQLSAHQVMNDFPRRLLPSRRAFLVPARGRLPPRGRAAAPARALRRAAPGTRSSRLLAGLAFPLQFGFLYLYIYIFLFAPLLLSLL